MLWKLYLGLPFIRWALLMKWLYYCHSGLTKFLELPVGPGCDGVPYLVWGKLGVACNLTTRRFGTLL
jgi:hypothetical protein